MLNLRTKLANVFLAALLMCSTGCKTVHEYSLTYKLWNNDDLNNYSEPAPDPKLALFQSPDHELLVTYDEERENGGKVLRRAYYLKPNLELIAKNTKPNFVKPGTAASLSPVQHSLTNRQAFMVVKDSTTEGPYKLPVYCESEGTAWKLGLTPFAVVGDTVMVGIVASVVAMIMMCEGGVGGTL